MGDVGLVRQKFEALRPLMDERMRYLCAGSEAVALGYGGIAVVAEATGMARNTVVAGIRTPPGGWRGPIGTANWACRAIRRKPGPGSGKPSRRGFDFSRFFRQRRRWQKPEL